MAHRDFMLRAIELAQKAYEMGEVPVGAVVVKDNKIIGEGYNFRESRQSALGHAEIMAIDAACKTLGSWRLEDCTLYVTMEPCIMCTGAIINSRISNVYFGAYDQKAGCAGTLYNLPEDERFNHRAKVVGGVMENECANLLSDFFKQKREKQKQQKNLSD